MLETKIDIKKSALLVIDMQNDLVNSTKEPFKDVTKMGKDKGIIDNTAKIIAVARQVNIPVIYACHVHRKDGADSVPTVTDLMLQGMNIPYDQVMVEGTLGAQIVDELKPAPEEHVILKRRASAFYNSDLELMLRSIGIDTIILAGVVTDGCVISTVQDARLRDFHIIVLSDCCATYLPKNDNYFIKNIFPRLGRVRTTNEVIATINN